MNSHKNELDAGIDIHKTIQSLKKEIKKECIEELMPQIIMQIHNICNISNTKVQSETPNACSNIFY